MTKQLYEEIERENIQAGDQIYFNESWNDADKVYRNDDKIGISTCYGFLDLREQLIRRPVPTQTSGLGQSTTTTTPILTSGFVHAEGSESWPKPEIHTTPLPTDWVKTTCGKGTVYHNVTTGEKMAREIRERTNNMSKEEREECVKAIGYSHPIGSENWPKPEFYCTPPEPPKWVKVSDRLPEAYKSWVVRYHNHEYNENGFMICELNDQQNNFELPCNLKATHWLDFDIPPLPTEESQKTHWGKDYQAYEKWLKEETEVEVNSCCTYFQHPYFKAWQAALDYERGRE